MKRNQQIDTFAKEFDKFISKFINEFDMTAAEIIGVITIKLSALLHNINNKK